MQITVHSDASVFESLHDRWHRLLGQSSCDTVFCTPEWLGCWWRNFGRGRPLHLVTVEQDGELLGVAPLMQSNEGGKRCRCFIGGVDVSDYFDLMGRAGHERAFLTTFLDHLTADPNWDVVDLHSVPTCSATLALLPDVARSRGYTVSLVQQEVCPIVDLPGTWESYLESLGKKDRHELRRKLRRLQAEGNWGWHTVSEAGELPKALDDFFDLHEKSSRNKADFWDDARRDFFRDNARAMLEVGWLRLSFLELDGRRVATIFAYDYRDTVSLYNSGYDPAHGYYSVGVLLVAFGIQDAIAAGRTRFDFLRGNEPYKYSFGARDKPVFNLRIARNAADCGA